MKAARRLTLFRSTTICATALGLSPFAFASGQMPILAGPVKFNSYNACVRALEAAQAEDAMLAAPLTVAADGKRHEVKVDSQGVERLGPQLARYDVTIWYHTGMPRPDLPGTQIEFSHSYEHPIRQCKGTTMTTTGNRGFTLSTFEPLTELKQPQP